MIIIKKLVKKSANLYTITCNDIDYDVYENTIIKLNLLSSSVRCEDVKEQISYYNNYYILYNKVLKKLSKSFLAKVDVENFLKKQTQDTDVIFAICEELVLKKIVDDNAYKKHYITSFEANYKYSSKKICDLLAKKNIFLTTQEKEILSDLDFDKAQSVINKLEKQVKDKSLLEFKMKCKLKLQEYQYNSTVISEVTNNICYNEYDAMLESYNKLSKRFDKKKVIQKLYSRGFDYNLIKEEFND